MGKFLGGQESKRRGIYWLVEVCEVFPATLCSLAMSEHIFHMEEDLVSYSWGVRQLSRTLTSGHPYHKLFIWDGQYLLLEMAPPGLFVPSFWVEEGVLARPWSRNADLSPPSSPYLIWFDDIGWFILGVSECWCQLCWHSEQAYGKRPFNPPFIHGTFNPAPGLVLVSCLIFGVSISSFFYRRQDKDPDQAIIFAFVIILTVIVGWISEASANLLLLGWLPWAVDCAMLIVVLNSKRSESKSLRQLVVGKMWLANRTGCRRWYKWILSNIFLLNSSSSSLFSDLLSDPSIEFAAVVDWKSVRFHVAQRLSVKPLILMRCQLPVASGGTEASLPFTNIRL